MVKPRKSISYEAYSLCLVSLRHAGRLSSVGEPKSKYADTTLQLIMCIISSRSAAICVSSTKQAYGACSVFVLVPL